MRRPVANLGRVSPVRTQMTRPHGLPWLRVCLAVLALAGGAGVAALMRPGSGRADYYPPQCGGDHIVEPRLPPHHQRPPLAIGDSTMLLAAYNLAAVGFEVDAQGCRQYDEALQILARRRAAGTLPHMVLIALGADGSVTHQDIGRALGFLCCTRLLVLVTNRELGGGSGPDAETDRQEARRHPVRIALLDWVAYSAGHGGDWFQPDGLHLTDVGARAFTRLLSRAMRWAYPRPHRRRRKPPSSTTTTGTTSTTTTTTTTATTTSTTSTAPAPAAAG